MIWALAAAYLAGALTVAVVVWWARTDPADLIRDPHVSDHMRNLLVHELGPVEGCELCTPDVPGAEALSHDPADTGSDRSIEPPTSAAPGTLTITADASQMVASIDHVLGSIDDALHAEPTAEELAEAQQAIYDAYSTERWSPS